jgi:hypothetical protein
MMTKTIGDGDARDFDETRRLLYMALLSNRTKKYNLAGTLVNALKHHHAVDLEINEIADRVVGVIEGQGDLTELASNELWVRDQIDRITAELGD